MKTLSRLFFLSLLIFTSSCGQEQDQLDGAGIEGIWEVTESNGVSSFTDVWTLSSDGFFCELKYLSDGATELECAGSGFWKFKKETLTIKYASEGGIKFPNPVLVKFDVAEDGEDYLLKIVKDKTSFGHNAKSQTLRLRRR